jgi:hypothetical protein
MLFPCFDGPPLNLLNIRVENQDAKVIKNRQNRPHCLKVL